MPKKLQYRDDCGVVKMRYWVFIPLTIFAMPAMVVYGIYLIIKHWGSDDKRY